MFSEDKNSCLILAICNNLCLNLHYHNSDYAVILQCYNSGQCLLAHRAHTLIERSLSSSGSKSTTSSVQFTTGFTANCILMVGSTALMFSYSLSPSSINPTKMSARTRLSGVSIAATPGPSGLSTLPDLIFCATSSKT